jgi:hypothetical protein
LCWIVLLCQCVVGHWKYDYVRWSSLLTWFGFWLVLIVSENEIAAVRVSFPEFR